MEDTVIVVVKGIIMYNGKVLIIKRSADDEIDPDTWECIGGKIEFGEDLENALKREAKEEAGITITVEKLLYATAFKINAHCQVILLAYYCTANDNIIKLSAEHTNYLWSNKKQMSNMLSKPIIDDFNRNSVWQYIFP